MREKSLEEKARDIFCYVEGVAFGLYYTTFSKGQVLSEGAGNWEEVSKALSDFFTPVETPEKYRLWYGSASRSHRDFVIFNGLDMFLWEGWV